MTLVSEAGIVAAVRLAIPDAEVTFRPPAPGSQNRHAVASRRDGTRLFIKAYADPGGCATERLVLDRLGHELPWPVLPAAGGTGAGACWLAFPLTALSPVTASPGTFRDWGRRLAEVHACAPPDGLEKSSRAVDLVDERLRKLEAAGIPDARDAAAAARDLWAAASGTLGREALTHREPDRLLTHDFGFRNTYRTERGSMVLIDFERAGTGDPHWELGKAWDRELRDPADARAFVAAYHAAMPGSEGWPHYPTLWTTRFAAALAAIPYAARVGDADFMHEAAAVLDVLREEIRPQPARWPRRYSGSWPEPAARRPGRPGP
jgi:hypothetical protein